MLDQRKEEGGGVRKNWESSVQNSIYNELGVPSACRGGVGVVSSIFMRVRKGGVFLLVRIVLVRDDQFQFLFDLCFEF